MGSKDKRARAGGRLSSARAGRPSRRVGAGHRPRGLDLLHLRRPRRHLRRPRRALRRGHAAPLAPRTPARRQAVASPDEPARSSSFEASFVLRNPVVAGLGHDEVAILRRRTVAGGLEERIELRNLSRRELSFPLDLELASDFADIFTVKENDPELDRPERPDRFRKRRPRRSEERGRALRFSDARALRRAACGDAGRALASPARWATTGFRYDVRLAPGAGWTLVLQVVPSSGFSDRRAGRRGSRRSQRSTPASSGSLARWRAGLPRSRRAGRSSSGAISRRSSISPHCECPSARAAN